MTEYVRVPTTVSMIIKVVVEKWKNCQSIYFDSS